MNRSKFILILCSLTTGILTSCNPSGKNSFSLKNTLDTDRVNEVVNINYSELIAIIGNPAEGKQFYFTENGNILISQFVDYENDGITDELLLEVSIPANKTVTIMAEQAGPEEYPVFSPKTNIRFAEHKDFSKELDVAERAQTTDTNVTSTIYQMEGPAWENDLVGFRNYFDLRNGMDIFGKRTGEMVLDEVGVSDLTVGAPEDAYGKSYHESGDWGMDILKVGNSLGAGSLALFTSDSLFRVGDNGTGKFERLYEGPLRSEFRFSFPDWKAGDKSYDIAQYISITAGSYSYKSRVFIDHTDEETSFVTGIVNLHSEKYTEKQDGNTTIIYTHDVQAFDTTYLTLALVMDTDHILETGTAPEEGNGITQTFWVKMKTEPGVQLSYSFYAFWETANPLFHDVNESLDIIRQEIKRKENPVVLIK